MLKCIIIKGNPIYKPELQNKLYNDLIKLLNRLNFEDIQLCESSGMSSDIPKADLYIMFSRGAGFIENFRKSKRSGIMIGIGTKNNKLFDLVVNNSKDNTFNNDLSEDLLNSHLTLSYDQKVTLAKFLKDLI